MKKLIAIVALLAAAQARASDYSAAVALHDAVLVLPKPVMVLEARTTMKATTRQVTHTGPLGLRQVTRTVTSAQPMITIRPVLMMPMRMAQPTSCGPSANGACGSMGMSRPAMAAPMMRSTPARAAGACST